MRSAAITADVRRDRCPEFVASDVGCWQRWTRTAALEAEKASAIPAPIQLLRGLIAVHWPTAVAAPFRIMIRTFAALLGTSNTPFKRSIASRKDIVSFVLAGRATPFEVVSQC